MALFVWDMFSMAVLDCAIIPGVIFSQAISPVGSTFIVALIAQYITYIVVHTQGMVCMALFV